jgi:hypothetical protein
VPTRTVKYNKLQCEMRTLGSLLRTRYHAGAAMAALNDVRIARQVMAETATLWAAELAGGREHGSTQFHT